MNAIDNLDAVNAVQRVQDYIESHIGEPITLYMLSRAAGYSPWHTSRLFKELTGKTLLEYIRILRLSRAALTLRDRDRKIIDVALDFAFDSHEGFTRAFTKNFGIAPQTYRKNAPPISLFMPSPIRSYYILLQKGASVMPKNSFAKTVFVQVIERPARKLILKRGHLADNYFDYCKEVGCEVWGLLCSIKEALYEPIGVWLPSRFREENTSFYAQGVEVPADYSGEIPAGFDIIDLPACKMMVFQSQPFAADDFLEAIEEVWQGIKTYTPELYGFQWADEESPRFQLEPVCERGYIEARPVRALS